MTLGTTPFVAPIKARRPLVRRWWQAYQKRDPKKATNIVTVYVFHYHLRLLFPKESGILIAYPSSLVGLCKKEYYTSRRYRKLAIDVLERDGGRCRVCNFTGQLQVHHRNYSYWGNESGLELTTLCDRCHSLFHDSEIELSNNGLFYVWCKPSGVQHRAVPWGWTNSMRLAREQRDKWWKA